MFRPNIIRKVLTVSGILLAYAGSEAMGQTSAWSLCSSTGPSARHAHSMAYDSARGKVVLFGGQAGSTALGDTWEWGGSEWTQRDVPGPSARYDSAMAYDSARQVVVLFGGNESRSRAADTWEWDGKEWKSRGIAGPGSRWEHAMAYDAHRGVVVLFGGKDSTGVLQNDTWEWNGGTWTQRLGLPTPLPTPRGYAAMAYDADRQRIVLFGGHDAGGLCGDTWEYDGVSWTERSTGGPSARDAAAMAYDKARDLTVLFGGHDGNYKQDTWAWNGTNWTQQPGTGPSGRYSHGLVYSGKILLFGGLDSSGEDRETWDYGANLTPLAACCFADGSCQDLAEAHCLGAGCVSWREGYSCTVEPCASPPPSHAYFLGDQPLSGSAAHQVNTATGNFHYSETDFSIASRGYPLAFTRYYNSMDRATGPVGIGWRHSYHIDLTLPNPPTHPFTSVTWANGQVTFWEPDGDDWKPATKDLHDKLEHTGGEWIVTRTNLDVYRFDNIGRLASIADKNSNTTTIAYDPVHTRQVTTVTDPASRVLGFNYDGDGPLTSVTAGFVVPPRVVHFAYTSGRLTRVTDVLGRYIDYGYDTNDYLATVEDQRDVTVITNTYAPDGTGQVIEYKDGNDKITKLQYRAGETEITRSLGARDLHWLHKSEMVYKRQTTGQDPLGHEVVYTYDENFNRESATDHNGNTTNYAYDDHGNVTSITAPDDPADPNDGGTTTIEYTDSRFPYLPTRKTDALGHVTEWTYDAHGNRLTARRYLTVPPATSFVEKVWTYNGFGQPLTETDHRGNTRQWHYTAEGLLDYSIDRAGNTTRYGYDSLWRRIWVTDGRGSVAQDPDFTTDYVYDAADRLTQATGPPVGESPHRIVRWSGYDEIGNRKWATNGNGSGPEDPSHTATYDYDGNSNLLAVHQPLGRITRYAYDDLDRKEKMADANGNLETQCTQYTYDDANRLTEVRDPENNVSSFTRDAHGNVLTATDPSSITITYEYDKLHRRTLKRDGLDPPNTWHTEYDKLSRVTRTIDATDQPTQFTYDTLGRLTGVLDAAGGSTAYTYDTNGNLLTILDANSHTISIRQYDDLNRLTRAEDGIGNYYTYGYDAVSNQTWVRDANDQPAGPTTTLTYDAENRRTAISYPDGTSVTYIHDNNGNRTSMTDPNGTSLFGYDELNRLVSTVDAYGKRVDYAYDPGGNRIRLTYPGLHPGDPGKELTYGYDTANRLTSITDWADRATQYTYNGLRVATVTFPNGVLETHGYDNSGRLTGLNTTLGETPVLGFEWTRDGVGSPLTSTETNTLAPVIPARFVTYEYDSDNRLTESSEGTYAYDNNGNLVSRTINSETTDFTYDDEDRLTLQTTGGIDFVEHVYDGDGNRIARVDNGVATRYVLDCGLSLSNVLCETDVAGNVIAYYIHGPTLVARIDAGNTLRYYHTNDLGNVVALTNAAGTVVDRYAYDPFGLPAGHEGTTPNPFTFVGGLGVMVENDGLYFMRARFYDPDTGRFLGKDPVEGALTNPLELNRYVYGLDNPVLLVDPDGEFFGFFRAMAKRARRVARNVVKRVVKPVVRSVIRSPFTPPIVKHVIKKAARTGRRTVNAARVVKHAVKRAGKKRVKQTVAFAREYKRRHDKTMAEIKRRHDRNMEKIGRGLKAVADNASGIGLLVWAAVSFTPGSPIPGPADIGLEGAYKQTGPEQHVYTDIYSTDTGKLSWDEQHYMDFGSVTAIPKNTFHTSYHATPYGGP